MAKHSITRSFLTTCAVCLMTLVLSVAGAQASPRQETLPGPVVAEVLAVLDGDTVLVRAHIWIGQQVETHVRIAGIDTPERRSACAEERDKAAAATQAITQLVAGQKIILRNIRLEKYAGRVLADAETAAGDDIARHMIATGHARPYHGAKRAAWC